MQEAFHRLETKVSHIYHHCNALVEKADGLSINQAVHMKMSSTPQTPAVASVASVPSVADVLAAVVTPEPVRKKPRLLTLYYPPTPQSTSQAASRSILTPVILCIHFVRDPCTLHVQLV